MEKIEQITESKVEEIKGTVYDVDIVKTPRYTEEEKQDINSQIEEKKSQIEAMSSELSVLLDKSKTF